MPTSSLATLKRSFSFDDNAPIEYEEKDGELFIRLRLVSKYSSNDEIINQAYKLAEQRKSDGWTREDFFNDFMKVRDEVLEKIREYYENREI
jgi:hypothetical protein